MNSPQPESAEVVVIGGGVIGTSVLHHLALRGCRDVVLLEANELGSGSTGAAAGGFRAQFSDELNIQMSLESIARFARFDDEIGMDIGFRQDGYLILFQPEHRAHVTAGVALQNSLGVPSRVLSLAEATSMVPGLQLDGLDGATFCPIDGSATPQAVVQGYALSARRMGATILQHRPVSRVLVRNGRVTGVETADGVINAAHVVLTAGVASYELAGAVGLSLPVKAERRYVYFVEEVHDLPSKLPLVVDFASGLYLHREGRGLLLGGPWSTPEGLIPALERRVPALLDYGVRAAWSGDYEMSPDHNAMIGSSADIAGLYYGTGFSGHGFQQAPVVGEHLADLVLGRPPRMDLRPLSADRFATAAARKEEYVI